MAGSEAHQTLPIGTAGAQSFVALLRARSVRFIGAKAVVS